jgi:hypothetical protein
MARATASDSLLQSISAVVREFVVTGLEGGKRRNFARVEDFRFVASGGLRKGKGAPVSEKHDAAWLKPITAL